MLALGGSPGRCTQRAEAELLARGGRQQQHVLGALDHHEKVVVLVEVRVSFHAAGRLRRRSSMGDQVDRGTSRSSREIEEIS